MRITQSKMSVRAGLLTAVCGLAMLSGCGGKSEDTTTPPPPGPSATADSKIAPVAAKPTATMDAVK